MENVKFIFILIRIFVGFFRILIVLIVLSILDFIFNIVGSDFLNLNLFFL